MVIWNEQLATGSPTIDAHHRMLIHNINELEMLLHTTNPDKEECELILNLVSFLESYAETHFKFEERCMERYRCPAHTRNKEAHQHFIEFFNGFKQRYKTEGFRPEVLKALHQQMSSWIRNHILQVDLQLRPCIKGQSESGAAPGAVSGAN